MRPLSRVLVTGGCGFIGSALVRHLLTACGAEVEVLVNLDCLTYAGSLDNVAAVAADPRYHFVEGDIRAQALVAALCDHFQIEFLIHCAAASHVDRSILQPLEFVEVNVLGTASLLEVVRGRPTIHFHQVSTDEVFGSLGSRGRFSLASPYQPRSPYAASKAAADHFVHAYAQTYGICATLSLSSNNYGPCQAPEKLVPVVLAALLEGRELPIYGDGSQVRDWLHVDDHVRGLCLAVREGMPGERFLFGGGAERSNLELARTLMSLVAEETGVEKGKLEALLRFVEDRPGHDFRYAFDTSATRKRLGFEPLIPLEQGLRETLRWYRAHADWVHDMRERARAASCELARRAEPRLNGCAEP